jgi:hypothetical protein
VVLGLLARYSAWGSIALPLLARLYVRQKDLPGIAPKHRPAFRTQLEMGVELTRWAVSWLLERLGKPVWVVADGACQGPVAQTHTGARGDRSQPATEGFRLRTVPGPRSPHRRGPKRSYGEQLIDLATASGDPQPAPGFPRSEGRNPV